jgi:hypothetical protein
VSDCTDAAAVAFDGQVARHGVIFDDRDDSAVDDLEAHSFRSNADRAEGGRVATRQYLLAHDLYVQARGARQIRSTAWSLTRTGSLLDDGLMPAPVKGTRLQNADYAYRTPCCRSAGRDLLNGQEA